MNDFTTMGGSNPEFPATNWSKIRVAANPASPAHRQALDELCRLYWKPVYAYVRSARTTGNDDAKDLTQEFLLELVEGQLFQRVPTTGVSFRSYLRGALKLFLLQEHRHASAQKRGGGRRVVSLDDADVKIVESLSVRPDRTPEEAFDGEWTHALLDQAVSDLHQELARDKRETWFRVFDRYELNPPAEAPTYAVVAKEFGIKETDVTNHLSACRKRLRELIEKRIRDYVSDDRELESELRQLFS